MKNGPLLVFSLDHFAPLGASLRSALGADESGVFSTRRFPNGELCVTVHSPVVGRRCLIVGTIAPPDERLLTVLILADAISRNGAASVELALPYCAYSRHDKGRGGEALTFPLLGRLLRAVGVDRLATIDLHNPNLIKDFAIELHSISPAPLFAAAVRQRGIDNITVVAPDEGARARALDVRRALGLTTPLVLGHKTRTGQRVSAFLEGTPTREALVVDDILDTGSTLIQTLEALKSHGVERAQVCVSHSLCTGEQWLRIWDLGVERVYTTDSVGADAIPPDPRIEIIPSGALIAQAIAHAWSIHHGTTVKL